MALRTARGAGSSGGSDASTTASARQLREARCTSAAAASGSTSPTSAITRLSARTSRSWCASSASRSKRVTVSVVPGSRQPVRVPLPVRAREQVEGAHAEPVFAPLDRGERVAPLALDLLFAEGRREQRLREEVEHGLEALARAVERDAEAAAAREGVDVGGERFDAARELGGAVRLRAAQPQVVGKLVSPAVPSVSTSCPPSSAARAATTGISRRGCTSRRTPAPIVYTWVLGPCEAPRAGVAKRRAAPSAPRASAARSSASAGAAPVGATSARLCRSGASHSRATRSRSPRVAPRTRPR